MGRSTWFKLWTGLKTSYKYHTTYHTTSVKLALELEETTLSTGKPKQSILSTGKQKLLSESFQLLRDLYKCTSKLSFEGAVLQTLHTGRFGSVLSSAPE